MAITLPVETGQDELDDGTDSGQETERPMRWVREQMLRKRISQRDIARAWQTSETTVSRFLDGTQSTDLSLSRAVALANLLREPIEELCEQLGHPVRTRPPVAVPEPSDLPPAPHASFRPTGKADQWELMLRLELKLSTIARLIASIENGAAEEMTPRVPPPHHQKARPWTRPGGEESDPDKRSGSNEHAHRAPGG